MILVKSDIVEECNLLWKPVKTPKDFVFHPEE